MTATFSFERRIGYYLIQVYFPDIFVVVLSWIVFWMDKDDMGNRMTLGITSILTIMFLLGSLNGNLPKVSYPKALDWYLLVSFSFVFLTLIECTIVFLFESNAKQDEEQIKFTVIKLLSPSQAVTFPSISDQDVFIFEIPVLNFLMYDGLEVGDQTPPFGPSCKSAIGTPSIRKKRCEAYITNVMQISSYQCSVHNIFV